MVFHVTIVILVCVAMFIVKGYLPSLLLKKYNDEDWPPVEGTITRCKILTVPDMFNRHVINKEIHIEYEYYANGVYYKAPKAVKVTHFDIRHPGGDEVIAKYAKGQMITVRYKASDRSKSKPIKKV